MMVCCTIERDGMVTKAVPIKEERSSSVDFHGSVELEPGVYMITTQRAKFRSVVVERSSYSGFKWGRGHVEERWEDRSARGSDSPFEGIEALIELCSFCSGLGVVNGGRCWKCAGLGTQLRL